MNTFDTALHPRAADGRFTATMLREAQVNLDPDTPTTVPFFETVEYADRQVLLEYARGFADGYTHEDVAALDDRLRDVDIRCVWAAHSGWGYGGDSELFVRLRDTQTGLMGPWHRLSESGRDHLMAQDAPTEAIQPTRLLGDPAPEDCFEALAVIDGSNAAWTDN